jgi:arginyl-tRNA synthetase
MNIDDQLKIELKGAFKACFDHDLSLEEINFQPTRKEFKGSHTFVLFPYLKVTKRKPEESGELLGNYLVEHGEMVSSFNTVKGFLNLELKDQIWLSILQETLDKNDLGQLESNGRKVMVEFSSPNTNKPLHLGHIRNILLGDSVSKILSAAGYDVMKTNLVNDRGIHICKSMLAYQKTGNNSTPEQAGVKGDHFVGNFYVSFDKGYKEQVESLVKTGRTEDQAKKEAPWIQEAQELLKKWENRDAETYALWEKMNGWVYDGFDKTYDALGIAFDKIYYESDTYLLGKDIVQEGLKKAAFYTQEDGSVWVDLTDEGLDEKLILRSDGTSVYITQDMGTCDYKYKDFPMEKSVYVVGNEQDYHFRVLFSIMKKLGRPYGEGLYHLSYGMVDLPTGKMKSREGTVVDADDLIHEMKTTAKQHTEELGKIEGMKDEEAEDLYGILGLGALKYFLLKVDPKKRMLFNPKESIEFQGHTGPFIQYTYARISAILRRAEQLGTTASIDKLKIKPEARELDIMNILTRFEQVIRNAGEEYSPAVVANYVYELAKAYNSFYQEVPIFSAEKEEDVRYRLALSTVTGRVIRKSMQLLGIDVPDRM